MTSERHHFLISSTDVRGNRFRLDGSEGHHAARVARLGEGDEIFLLDRRGRAYRATIHRIRTGIVEGSIGETLENYHESMPRVHLGIGILKGENMDLVVEKGTELGVYSITPLIMKFNVKKLVRLERLTRIAESAAKQCGRGHVPVISDPVSFEQWCSRRQGQCAAVMDHSDGSISVDEWLDTCGSDMDDVWLAVGPEGGYHKTEIASVLQAKTARVSLGPRRLRSETAALAALAICDTRFATRRKQ